MERVYAQVTWRWRDGTGSETTTQRYLPAGISSAAAHTRAAALGALMAAVSSCALLGYELLWQAELEPSDDPTTPTNPHGVLFFSTDTEGQVFALAVPGVRPGLILPPAPGEPAIDLDTTAPALVALVAELCGQGWCNPFGYDLVALAAAYIEVRAYGRVYIP